MLSFSYLFFEKTDITKLTPEQWNKIKQGSQKRADKFINKLEHAKSEGRLGSLGKRILHVATKTPDKPNW